MISKYDEKLTKIGIVMDYSKAVAYTNSPNSLKLEEKFLRAKRFHFYYSIVDSLAWCSYIPLCILVDYMVCMIFIKLNISLKYITPFLLELRRWVALESESWTVMSYKYSFLYYHIRNICLLWDLILSMNINVWGYGSYLYFHVSHVREYCDTMQVLREYSINLSDPSLSVVVW